MEYRNPVYNASGGIDMEINHPAHGWIPFTADSKDSEEYGRQLFEAAKNEAVLYEPPPPQPEPVPPQVSRRQAKQQLLLEGLLGQIEPAIDAIEDATEREMVRIYWQDAAVFRRDNAQLNQLGAALGLTDNQIDDLFKKAAKL